MAANGSERLRSCGQHNTESINAAPTSPPSKKKRLLSRRFIVRVQDFSERKHTSCAQMCGKDNRMEKNEQALKQALLDNLTARGLTAPVYADKVAEYMDLWRHRQMARADIEQRGVSIMDERRGMKVENKSVALEVQLSRQMMAIFTALGFRRAALDAVEPFDDYGEL